MVEGRIRILVDHFSLSSTRDLEAYADFGAANQ